MNTVLKVVLHVGDVTDSDECCDCKRHVGLWCQVIPITVYAHT